MEPEFLPRVCPHSIARAEAQGRNLLGAFGQVLLATGLPSNAAYQHGLSDGQSVMLGPHAPVGLCTQARVHLAFVIAAAQVWPRLMGCINSILMQVLYQGHRQRSSYALFLLRSAVHSPFLQAGKHSEKRESYGHSLIVDPWGTVLTRLNGSETGASDCVATG
eukprot:1153644-Pelagomonas_calceolata.AAC.6